MFFFKIFVERCLQGKRGGFSVSKIKQINPMRFSYFKQVNPGPTHPKLIPTFFNRTLTINVVKTPKLMHPSHLKKRHNIRE
jgi:hypothetical protein